MVKRSAWPVWLGSLLPLVVGCADSNTVDNVNISDAHVPVVNVVSVAETSIASTVELTGTLYPWKYATIASEVTGVIESIEESGERFEYEVGGQAYSEVLPLDIGQPVVKDQVLMKIRSSEQEHALQLAEAKCRLAEKELANLFAWKRAEEIAQLKAQCEECDAILLDAEADLARYQDMIKSKAASTQEVQDAQRAVASARAAKKRAAAALELAQAGPTQEEIEVAKAQFELARADVTLKREMVEKCTIRCPLDQGWVVERYVGLGDHVTANPSTPLLRVVDSSILLAQVSVPERYQGLIQVHDRASVTVDGGRAAELEQTHVEAMVLLVNAQIDPDTRTFRVRVGIDNSQNLFKAGTFVKVSIPLRSLADAVVVPAEAITFSRGEPAVFTVREGVVDRVPVQLGISNRTHYQVVSGLSPDELVVCGNLSVLAPGLRVQVRHATAATSSTAEEPTAPVTQVRG
jgi:membrane fusion protein (multidrug efflux system)